MTHWMRSWVLSITCAAMASAFIEILLPRGALRRVGQLAGALLLLLAAVQPFLRWDESALADLPAFAAAGADSSAQAGEDWAREIKKQLIEERAAAYIQDKAEALGIRCRPEVSCVMDSNGAAGLTAAHITLYEGQGRQEELARLIEEELGIARENQVYEGGQAP